MDDDKLLEKIRKLVKDEIRPVKESTEIIKQNMNHQGIAQDGVMANVRLAKEQQSVMNEKLDSIFEQTVKLTEDLSGVKETLAEHIDKIDGLTVEMYELDCN